MTDPVTTLVVLFYGDVPAVSEIDALLAAHGVVTAALLARTDSSSARAAMWTRDPLQRLPSGRLALELDDNADTGTWLQALTRAFDGVTYECRAHTPLALPMAIGEVFDGTLQLCCFQRRSGLTDDQLSQFWLAEHTEVAVTTQNTLGYRQNWVLSGGEPRFDGIVEEYFPPEASESMNAFFADGQDEALMWAHVQRLTASSERFLDLDRTEVIHLTDTRIR